MVIISMNLPFGLKQKPLNHYFEHGLVKFNMREGVMYYTVKKITKSVNATLLKERVQDKQHLDRLLSIKNLSEVQSLII